MPWLLNATWLLPALLAAVLALLPAGRPGLLRSWSLAGALLNLLLIAALLAVYLGQAEPAASEATVSRLAFASRLAWFPALGIDFFTGADAINLCMMLLAAVIAVGGILVSWRLEHRVKAFQVLLQILLAGTYGCFISFDLFTFFFFNELTLIPTYLLIALFGSPIRWQRPDGSAGEPIAPTFAAMKLTLMLFAGSALIIVGLAGIATQAGTFDLLRLAAEPLPASSQLWIFPCLFGGFAILGSVFPFHTWSPMGHAAAPTAISMFLAGVHMKLGGYGCLRAAMSFLPIGALEWLPVFLGLGTISVVLGAWIALRQRDLKYINAYASISHVGLVTVGFASLTALGLRGGVLQMLSHGFVTALVFALIGAVYRRTQTRLVPELGGLMRQMPILGVAFVLAGFAVVGLPLSSSFVAELTLFFGLFADEPSPWRVFCGVLCILTVIVTAVYVLRTVNGVVHGPAQERFAGLPDADGPERLAIGLLLACILALGLVPGSIVDAIDASLLPILNNLETAR